MPLVTGMTVSQSVAYPMFATRPPPQGRALTRPVTRCLRLNDFAGRDGLAPLRCPAFRGPNLLSPLSVLHPRC